MTNIDWSGGLSAFFYCLEIFFAVSLFTIHLKRRKLSWIGIAMAVSVYYFMAVLIHPILDTWMNWIWFVFVLIISCILCLFCYDISLWDAIYATSCGFLTQHSASSIYIFFSYKGEVPVWEGHRYIITYICTYVFVYILIARHLSYKGKYDVTPWLAMLLFFSVIAFAVGLSMWTKNAADNLVPSSMDMAKESGISLMHAIQVYSFAVCLILLLMQRVLRKEIHIARKLEKTQALWKQRQNQYRISKENIELINHKCHDLKHQIKALSLDHADVAQRSKMMKEIEDMVDVYDQNTDTGNEALNTILMEKGLYCYMHDIQWSCVADGNLLNFMDVVDLYTLLGNALDNSIEAVEKISDKDSRVISLRLWQKEQFIMLQIENYYEGNIKMKDGIPVTSKGDTFSHGIGLKSMRRIVEQYDGYLSTLAEQGRFLLNIVFPIKGQQ